MTLYNVSQNIPIPVPMQFSQVPSDIPSILSMYESVGNYFELNFPEMQCLESDDMMPQECPDVTLGLQTLATPEIGNQIRRRPRDRGSSSLCLKHHVRRRDIARAAEFQMKKEAQSQNIRAPYDLTKCKMDGAYWGERRGLHLELSAENRHIVPMGDGRAVRVYSNEGRMFIYRGYNGPSNKKVNECAIKALKYISDNNIKPRSTTSKRGNFNSLLFMLHRENQMVPRVNDYSLDKIDFINDIIAILNPLIELADRTFKAHFPQLHSHYSDALQFIHNWNPELPIWSFPFAGICINTGKVVCTPHKDALNFGPGLCCIIPFGTFKPEIDCRVVVEEIGMEFELAPGVPLFVPSALVSHYNTILLSKGFRGSIVLWTGGSIFQWVDLGGRAIQELTKTELEVYKKNKEIRIIESVNRFPLHCDFLPH